MWHIDLLRVHMYFIATGFTSELTVFLSTENAAEKELWWEDKDNKAQSKWNSIQFDGVESSALCPKWLSSDKV